MKITKSKLKQIIQEEARKLMVDEQLEDLEDENYQSIEDQAGEDKAFEAAYQELLGSPAFERFRKEIDNIAGKQQIDVSEFERYVVQQMSMKFN